MGLTREQIAAKKAREAAEAELNAALAPADDERELTEEEIRRLQDGEDLDEDAFGADGEDDDPDATIVESSPDALQGVQRPRSDVESVRAAPRPAKAGKANVAAVMNENLAEINSIRHTKQVVNAQKKFTVILAEHYENEPEVRVIINSHTWHVKRGIPVLVPESVMQSLIAAREIQPQREEDRHLYPGRSIRPLGDGYNGENIETLTY